MEEGSHRSAAMMSATSNNGSNFSENAGSAPKAALAHTRTHALAHTRGLAALLPVAKAIAPKAAAPPASSETSAPSIPAAVAPNQPEAGAEIDPLDAFMREIAHTQQEAAAAAAARKAGASAKPADASSSQSSTQKPLGSAGTVARSSVAAPNPPAPTHTHTHAHTRATVSASSTAASKRQRSDSELEESFAGEGYMAATADGDASGDVFEDSDEERAHTRTRNDWEKGGDADPLGPIDHAAIPYENFRKEFYTEAGELAALDDAAVSSRRATVGVTVEFPGSTTRAHARAGHAPAAETAASSRGLAPIASFDELRVADRYPAIGTALQRAGYAAPTAIQAQVLPLLLAGHDVLGLAQTGSGKTLAYVLPMVRHCIDQREIKAGEGPIAVVLAPTRELAVQIHAETRKFAAPLGMKAIVLGGGANKWEQSKALRAGCEIIIATPGRLIDQIRDGATNLRRVTYLVLDEADRMLDMGFTKQVYSIVGHIRPDRQTAMLSATFKPKVESLALASLRNPVKVVAGAAGVAASEVTQHAYVLAHEEKWPWLADHIRTFLNQDEGKVLIFVSSKAAVDELVGSLSAALGPSPTLGAAVVVLGIHGDKMQFEREAALAQFRTGACKVLVATDVAARGLDIRGVTTVISFDAARTIETHVHRVGRTGRLGPDGMYMPGVAITLVTPKEVDFAADLVHNLQQLEQTVPRALLQLAERKPGFRPWQPSAPSATAHLDGGPVRPWEVMARAAPQSTSGLGFDSSAPQRAPPMPRPAMPALPVLNNPLSVTPLAAAGSQGSVAAGHELLALAAPAASAKQPAPGGVPSAAHASAPVEFDGFLDDEDEASAMRQRATALGFGRSAAAAQYKQQQRMQLAAGFSHAFVRAADSAAAPGPTMTIGSRVEHAANADPRETAIATHDPTVTDVAAAAADDSSQAPRKRTRWGAPVDSTSLPANGVPPSTATAPAAAYPVVPGMPWMNPNMLGVPGATAPGGYPDPSRRLYVKGVRY